jgi:hypothetical protein
MGRDVKAGNDILRYDICAIRRGHEARRISPQTDGNRAVVLLAKVHSGHIATKKCQSDGGWAMLQNRAAKSVPQTDREVERSRRKQPEAGLGRTTPTTFQGA